MKTRHYIGLGIIAVFFIFSFFSFKDSLTPYVNFSQAKTMKNVVQVRGVLVAGNITPSDNGAGVKFKLRDENGEEATVAYDGPKPDGLEQASSIVAVGKFQNGQFTAEKLLVKCPSKYQAAQGSVSKP